MRKGIVFCLAAAVCAAALFFAAYKNGAITKESRSRENVTAGDAQTEKSGNKTDNQNEELRGVFLTCYETADLAKNKTQAQYTRNVENLLDRLKAASFNTVFFQVRAFSDALYFSDIFPCSEYIKNSDGSDCRFDAFKIFLECARRRGIGVHAWINPFRISYKTDIESLPRNSPALKLCKNNAETGAVVVCEKGIYFNPASVQVQNLILDGLREILEKYAPDGIHFDDYFYPECEFDDDFLYNRYVSGGGILCREDWRRNNVSALISAAFSLVKSFGDGSTVFGISPAANIKRDNDMLFADVKAWCKNTGYVDYIMPQIYFGFENEAMPFFEAAAEWSELCAESEVELYLGMAAYKCGQTDENAGKGADEWMVNSDILARQYVQSVKKGVFKGFCLFSYSFAFGKNANEISEKEIKTLLNVIQ